MVENAKLKEMQDLSLRISLDINETIDTLNLIVKHDVAELPDDQLHMRSVPALVARELERIHKETEKVWNYLYEGKF